MKKVLLIFAISFGLTQITKAQVVTCLPCDQLGMSVNVGSDTTALSIHHSGNYLTSPSAYNIFSWEFTDNQGNIIFQDTIIDASLCNFSHSFPITDTMNVTVYLRNDSAILPDGNFINCLFEDKIYWKADTFSSGNPYGYWEFINGDFSTPGVDLNTQTGIDNIILDNKRLLKVVDILGRDVEERKNISLFYIYDDGTAEKKIIIE